MCVCVKRYKKQHAARPRRLSENIQHSLHERRAGLLVQAELALAAVVHYLLPQRAVVAVAAPLQDSARSRARCAVAVASHVVQDGQQFARCASSRRPIVVSSRAQRATRSSPVRRSERGPPLSNVARHCSNKSSGAPTTENKTSHSDGSTCLHTQRPRARSQHARRRRAVVGSENAKQRTEHNA